MKHCPRCSSEISQTDKVCPRCGLPVSEMKDFEEKFNLGAGENSEVTQETKQINKKKENKKLEKKRRKEEKKAAREKEIAENEVDFSKFAVNSGVSDPDEILDTDTYAERRKKKKKLDAKPRFMIDENGEFNIDTKDVEIVGEETGKIIEKQYEQSYSVKKSRGDYIPPKLKWWEIYKFADRHFARSKIKKEVNKAAKIRPSYVKKSTLLLLCIFLGFVGAHNFYAKNKKRGWFSVITFTISVLGTALEDKIPILKAISISVIGFCGFLFLFVWISDLLNIIFNQFKFKFQRDRFIAGLNVETRAKLGRKYIDMELYHKPWWVRFGVWCEDVKRDHEIRKREKRQANIEREKQKLKEQEELAKQEAQADIYANQSGEGLNNSDIKEGFTVNKSTIAELETFDSDGEEESELETPNGDGEEETEDADLNEETETEDNLDDSQDKKSNSNAQNPYAKKYAKTVKNKKAAKRKKK